MNNLEFFASKKIYVLPICIYLQFLEPWNRYTPNFISYTWFLTRNCTYDKNNKIINLFPICNILFVDFYWYDKTRIIMSGLIDKDDAMQSYKKKKYFTRTKAFIFPYFYWSFYRTYVTIFASTIITLSQIGLINYDLVKNAFLFRTIRYLLLSLMHYFYTSHKRVFTLLKQKV